MIEIKLEFSDDSALSIDSTRPDTVEMKVLRRDLFIGTKSQQGAVIANRAQEQGIKIYIRNFVGIKDNIESVLDTSESFEKAVEAIFAANVILVIFFSGAI